MRAGLAWPLAAFSGLALAAAFPRPGLWPLAWIAPLGFLLAVRGRSFAAVFGRGWLFGFSFYLGALYWIPATIADYTRIGMPVAVLLLVLLAATVAVGMGACALVVEWLAQAGISRVLSAPLAWVVVEWLRTFFPVGFPWVLLGYSQMPWTALIQMADVTGVYGISALLMFASASLVEILRDGPRRHRRLVAALAVVVAAVLVYGHARMHVVDAASRATVKVALVQGNIAQDLKWDERWQNSILRRYLVLSQRAADAGARLIVWPESALPLFPAADPRAARVVALSASTGAHMLVGAPGFESRGQGPPRSYNQAWHVTPLGGFEAAYDKMQLVPFGEYVPFGGLWGGVERAVEGIADFGRGSEFKVFEGPLLPASGEDGSARPAAVVEPLRFSALICYEGIFPALAGAFVSAGAEMLVNISNDAWYGRSSAPYQHMSMAAMRAVEQRVPLLRATNTGISAVVDASGRVGKATELFTTEVVTAEVRLSGAYSLYSKVGDLFIYLAIAALGLLCAMRVRLGRAVGAGWGKGIDTRPGPWNP